MAELFTDFISLCYDEKQLYIGMSDSFPRERIEKGSQLRLTRCPPL